MDDQDSNLADIVRFAYCKVLLLPEQYLSVDIGTNGHDVYAISVSCKFESDIAPNWFKQSCWALNPGGSAWYNALNVFTGEHMTQEQKALLVDSVELAARACGAHKVNVKDGPYSPNLTHQERVLFAGKGYVWNPNLAGREPSMLPVSCDGQWIKNF